MRLNAVSDSPNAPDVCLERTLSARLIKLWYSIRPAAPNQAIIYDPAIVEEHYEKLHHDFIVQLPPAFAFENPDTQWDHKLPMLPRQRHMLRISVLVILCQLLRPLLQLSQPCIRAMPQYKRNLLLTHRGHLVHVATSLLSSVSTLHELMGGNQTRYFLVSFYTFEPAMLLGMHLLSVDLALETLREVKSSKELDSLWNTPVAVEAASSIYANQPSIQSCRDYINSAARKLEMLCEVNVIATTGLRALKNMMSRLDRTAEGNKLSSEIPNLRSETFETYVDGYGAQSHWQDNIGEPWLEFDVGPNGLFDEEIMTAAFNTADAGHGGLVNDIGPRARPLGTALLREPSMASTPSTTQQASSSWTGNHGVVSLAGGSAGDSIHASATGAIPVQAMTTAAVGEYAARQETGLFRPETSLCFFGRGDGEGQVEHQQDQDR